MYTFVGEPLRRRVIEDVGPNGREGDGQGGGIDRKGLSGGQEGVPVSPDGRDHDGARKSFGNPDGGGLRDGKARLWNPPFDFLPLFIREVEVEGGFGSVVGSEVDCITLVRALAPTQLAVGNVRGGGGRVRGRKERQQKVGIGHGRDRVREE